MIKSFAPVIDERTRILILGTMPGEASLKAGEYYGHKQNAFWKIMARRFNGGREWVDYADKISCLCRNGVGLWDNLKYCSREGSLDSDIKNPQPNDLAALLAKYPGVRKLLFNGKKSYEFFRRFQAPLLERYAFAVMPSTSPANATVSGEEKYRQWSEALIEFELDRR